MQTQSYVCVCHLLTTSIRRLADDGECKHKSIFGLVGLSAWSEFIGDKGESRFNHGKLILRLSEGLDWHLPSNICSELLHALITESSYWAPDIDNGDRGRILHNLIAAFPSAPSEQRPWLACLLVILTLGLNRGATHLRLPPISENTDIEAGTIRDPASLILKHYITHPNEFREHEQQLSLLALTGLLEHFEHCNFDDQSQENVKSIAQQLSSLNILGKSQSVTLPEQTLLNFDIRVYLAEVLALYIRQAQASPQLGNAEVILTHLLGAVHNKRGFWVDHGSLLSLPILQTLSQTKSTALQILCLSASIHNLEIGSSFPYVKMFFAFDIPYKLVVLANLATTKPVLRLNASLAFQFVAEQMQNATSTQQQSPIYIEVRAAALDLLHRVLSDNLLETFIRHILNPDTVVARREFWEKKILVLIQNPGLSDEHMDRCLAGTLWYLMKLGLADKSQGTNLNPQASSGQEGFLDALFKAIDTPKRSEFHIFQPTPMSLSRFYRGAVF